MERSLGALFLLSFHGRTISFSVQKVKCIGSVGMVALASKAGWTPFCSIAFSLVVVLALLLGLCTALVLFGFKQ
jgi:hypothetical protein